MKKTFTYYVMLLLLISAFSCRRQEIEYGIVAEFPGPFSSENKCRLVITDLDNNVVLEKEVTDFTGTTLIETFTLRLKKPIEIFNAHIIIETSLGGDEKSTQVYSHLGLKNAGSFRVFPDLIPPASPPTQSFIVNLGANNPQQGYHFIGVAANSLSFSPDVLYQVFLQEGQGLVVLREDIGTSALKRCYLSPEMIRDTMVISPSKFIDFPGSVDFTLEKSPWGNQLQAYAISPDKKKFVHLENNFFDIDRIAVPEGIPSDWRFYFKTQVVNGYVEKESPNEMKTIDLNPQISLKSKAYKDGILSMECSEGVDWLRVGTYNEANPSGFSTFFWSIEGHPDQFKRFEVPDLSPYYSNSAKIKGQLFKQYEATLIRSGEFDYEDMLRGLPWKTGEAFRNGKKGLEVVYVF